MGTDNSKFAAKVKLRSEVVSKVGKDKVHVLDMFAGRSKLWNEIKKRFPDKTILVYSIEKEKGKNMMALNADNMKVVESLDLSKFDIIDIDAYGIPYTQLEKVFRKNYHGYVIVTAISSMLGRIPNGLLSANNITRKMIDKIPTIFSPKMFQYLENYLYLCGVQQVIGYFLEKERKYYFYFKT